MLSGGYIIESGGGNPLGVSGRQFGRASDPTSSNRARFCFKVRFTRPSLLSLASTAEGQTLRGGSLAVR